MRDKIDDTVKDNMKDEHIKEIENEYLICNKYIKEFFRKWVQFQVSTIAMLGGGKISGKYDISMEWQRNTKKVKKIYLENYFSELFHKKKLKGIMHTFWQKSWF